MDRFTTFNLSLEQGDAEESFECEDEPEDMETVMWRHGEHLYNLLARRPDDCMTGVHRALLQLSEAQVDSKPKAKKILFHMFLSTCPGADTVEGRQEWHETTCSMTV